MMPAKHLARTLSIGVSFLSTVALVDGFLATANAAELVPMSELLKRGFELKAVVYQNPTESNGDTAERLYLQKGAQIVLCIFHLPPPLSGRKEIRSYMRNWSL
jgi:hypothetical protein